MIDLSAIRAESWLGRTLRVPLNWLPPDLVVPILQGPARGMRWLVGASTHGCWIGSYETDLQRACRRLVRPGMVVYDLGANVGFYSLLFSRLVGRHGTVHAFEPLPRNFQYLRRHLALNGIVNALLHPVAVGQSSGSARFDPGPHPSMGRVVTVGGAFEVLTTSLDEFVFDQQWPAPDLVKMDIEGGEAATLAGMRRLLRERPPLLLIALHGAEPARRCADILRAECYRFMDLWDQPIDRLPDAGEIIARGPRWFAQPD